MNDIEIDLIPMKISKLENQTPEFAAINPNKTVPTLVDKDFVLWESQTILRYLH